MKSRNIIKRLYNLCVITSKSSSQVNDIFSVCERFRFQTISNRWKSNQVENSMIWFLENRFDSISNRKMKSNQSVRFRIESFRDVVFTLSNNDNSEIESSFVSFNSCIIRQSTFFDDKIVWCICLFRSSNSSINRFSERLTSELTLSFFFLINKLF
jgi:hypothetical protein